MQPALQNDMMDTDLDTRKASASQWFRDLRDDICARFEALENELTGTYSEREAGTFERKPWEKSPEDMLQGSGEVSIMKGRVFEKVGVNISTVYGEFSEAFRKEIPGADNDPRFWASGISLVAHMQSPLVPAAHFNTRMITVGDGTRLWFGGGGDLNPMFEVEQDTADFHNAYKPACDALSDEAFPTFQKWCDEYFFIPHRNQARGVGGIFYDYVGLHALGKDTAPVQNGKFGKGGVNKEHTRAGMELAANLDVDWNKAFDFTQQVGRAFADIYPEIIRRHINESWTEEQREHQLHKRGLYAEYNLLYDRGTRFGLMTGGNADAILMSLPPEAKWS